MRFWKRTWVRIPVVLSPTLLYSFFTSATLQPDFNPGEVGAGTSEPGSHFGFGWCFLIIRLRRHVWNNSTIDIVVTTNHMEPRAGLLMSLGSLAARFPSVETRFFSLYRVNTDEDTLTCSQSHLLIWASTARIFTPNNYDCDVCHLQMFLFF